MAIVHTCSISVKQMNNIETIPQGPDLATIDVLTVLQALSDPVRLEIVRNLASCGESERRCGDFALPVTKSTLTHHFRVLRESGVIEQSRDGTAKVNRLRREDLDARFPGLLDSVLRCGGG